MSRPDIDSAVSRMPSKLGSKREIKDLPNQLWEGEQVLHLASGFYGGGTGLLVVTDRRVLFFMKGVMRTVSEDFLYDKISSVEYRSGILFGKITIYVSNQKADIDQIDKNLGKQIVDDIRGILASNQGSAIAPAAVPTQSDTTEQLLKLKQLYDAGILTSDEYETKRQQLISYL